MNDVKLKSRIPVSAAKSVADQFDLRQCLLIGWDGDFAHVVTYGRTKEDCESAAKAQDFWTGKIREFSFKGETTSPLPEEVRALVLAAREVLAAHSTGRFDPLQAACEALDNALDPFEEVE